MLCGCGVAVIAEFLGFLSGESVVDFIRGDFPVAHTVAGA